MASMHNVNDPLEIVLEELMLMRLEPQLRELCCNTVDDLLHLNDAVLASLKLKVLGKFFFSSCLLIVHHSDVISMALSLVFSSQRTSTTV